MWKKHRNIIFFHMCTMNEGHMIYGFLRYKTQHSLFIILGHFLTLLTTQKIKTLKKIKNMAENIIILYLCITNDNHMMYGSWNMECERENFLSFWTIFCPFTTITTQKIKILKKWKKCLEMLSFYTSTPEIKIIWYICIYYIYDIGYICILPNTLKIKSSCHSPCL